MTGEIALRKSLKSQAKHRLSAQEVTRSSLVWAKASQALIPTSSLSYECVVLAFADAFNPALVRRSAFNN